MTALPTLTVDDFAAFFSAVHGVAPFPWQERLIRTLASGGWPSVLDLPTGSGKTAVLDAAVFALALEAGADVRVSPRRIVYVVDRRTIVDQAYERARRIERAVLTGEADVLSRVRARLEHYTGGRLALSTALLRGGIARDDEWAAAPDVPLMLVSTVDQAGSRLLFRGYGVSESMRPVHAALLGSDALYLLDEVHLSQPFRETLQAITDRYQGWATSPARAPFTTVEMSATPGAPRPGRFTLNPHDREHPVLAQRLTVSKPTELISVAPKSFIKELERRALAFVQAPGSAVAVVVNRVNTAREAHARLLESAPAGTRVHLLTGRMRPVDRDSLEQTVWPGIRAGRERPAEGPSTIVVATQSIEAGADLDFDAVVTEGASLDALRQRFGRLDRLGAMAGRARGVVVTRTDSRKDDPVYGNAIGLTEAWLAHLAVDGAVDFGLDGVSVPDDAEERGLLTPRAHAPVLLPSHLDAWVQTAPAPVADPEVALWLHGPKSGVADVQVVWRSDISGAALARCIEAEDDASSEPARERVVDAVTVSPPSSGEALAVPFVAAKRWLLGESEPSTADVEGAADEEPELRRGRAETQPRPALVWAGDESRVVLPSGLRPGQTIVVPSEYGGVAHGNWAPASAEPVVDVAEVAAWRQRRVPRLRLHPTVAELWFERAVVPVPDDADEESADDRATVKRWLADVAVRGAHPDVQALVDWLRSDSRLKLTRCTPAGDGYGADYFVVTGRRRPASGSETSPDATTAAAASAFTGVCVTLSRHASGVAERAEAYARNLQLPEALIRDIRLAAVWHDAGKADPRFQRWLHGGSEFKVLTQAEPLAKGTVRHASPASVRAARARSGYPSGARHECVSLALATSADVGSTAGDWTLVRHLIASHHGHARPLVPWAPDQSPVDVSVNVEGTAAQASSAHGYERLDTGIADAFWATVRQHGWWTHAVFEAVLRLADHAQSAAEQRTFGRQDD